MKSEPRIAAYLGVKDEVELIEPCIAHLRSIGVEHIMACDMSSTDGTAEVLEGIPVKEFQCRDAHKRCDSRRGGDRRRLGKSCFDTMPKMRRLIG